MRLPGKAEIEAALAEAEHMYNNDKDGHYIAQCLLAYYEKSRLLEHVFEAAEHYLRGMGEKEHMDLQLAVDRVRAARRADDSEFGLE